MGACIDWNFNGKNVNGDPLYSKQIEALIAFDEFDFDCNNFEFTEGLYEFAIGATESLGAKARIRAAVEQFSKLYPATRLVALYKYDTDWCPDGFIAEGGEVVDISGHVIFNREDNGQEVFI